jgi:hypothetical protein
MKKLLCLATLFVTLIMFASCEKKGVITESQLPASSREFLKMHFAGVDITRIIKESEVLDKDYTVYLQNGFKVDFTKSGAWDEVNGLINELPQSILDLLPASIMQYVGTAFSSQKIVKVNKERFGYEIELSGDIELEFDSNGNLLEID